MESLDVVVAAAGCFGVSTAVRLPQENRSSVPIYVVTVNNTLDGIPYPDIASTDLNKSSGARIPIGSIPRSPEPLCANGHPLVMLTRSEYFVRATLS